MPTNGESVNPSLRQILTDSHVSAIAIAVLLFGSLDSAFWALWHPFSLMILDIRHFFTTRTIIDPFTFFITFSYLFDAFIYLLAAELLSRWTYGMGPFRSLSYYRTRLARSKHV